MDDEEIELVSKAPVLKDTGKLSKEEFDIDIENEKVVCPEGKVAEKCYQSKEAEGKITKTFFSRKSMLMILCRVFNDYFEIVKTTSKAFRT